MNLFLCTTAIGLDGRYGAGRWIPVVESDQLTLVFDAGVGPIWVVYPDRSQPDHEVADPTGLTVSVQPDGGIQGRPAGTAGAFEVYRKDNQFPIVHFTGSGVAYAFWIVGR